MNGYGKFLLVFCILLVGGMFLSPPMHVKAEENVLGTLIQGIEYNDSMIKNNLEKGIRFTYFLTYFRNPTTPGEPPKFQNTTFASLKPVDRKEYDLMVKGKFYRVEWKVFQLDEYGNKEKKTFHQLWVWNGQENRGIDYIDNTGFFFNEQKFNLLDSPLTEEENFKHPFWKPRSDAWKRPGLEQKVVGSDTIDGHSCYIVETTKENGIVIKTWVAPNQGFGELKKVITTSKYEHIVQNNYQKYNNFWFINKSTRIANLISPTKKVPLSRWEFQVENVESGSVPDSMFSLSFPDNSEKIYDGIVEDYIKPIPLQ